MIQRLSAFIRTRGRDPRWFVPALVLLALVVAGAVVAAVVLSSGGGAGARRASIGEPAGFAISPQGAEVPRLAAVKVTFEKRPGEQDGAKLVTLEPAAKGTYAWLSDRTLIFQPDFPGLLQGKAYTVHVAAAPDAGLAQPVAAKFTVAGKLTVDNVIPAPNDVEVPKNVQVLIQFSRAVAALTVLSAQTSAVPVTFDPPLKGKGEWLNTSLYRFTPVDLAPNTKYAAKVAAGLTSEADGVLDGDYTWSFTTFGPALDSVSPDDQTKFAALDQAVVLKFNQPMDRASVQSGVSLLSASGSAVAGSLAWSDGDATATFTPAARLGQEAVYRVQVQAGLAGAKGGATAAARTTSFTTIGAPRVASTDPAGGATGTSRFGIGIRFSNPMNIDSLDGKVSVSGIDPAQLQVGNFGDPLNIYINSTLKPSTLYTVRIAAGATDRYGQALAPYAFSFTTGALPSSVDLAVPNGFGTYSASVEPVLFYHATNTASASFTLYRLTADEAQQALANNGQMPQIAPNQPWKPSQPPLRSWNETNPATKDQVLILSTSLSGGGTLAKGDYFVTSSNARLNSSLFFSVVDTALVAKVAEDQLLVWALDLDTGKPLASLPLAALDAPVGKGVAPTRSLQAKGATTDANGLATFALNQVPAAQKAGFSPPPTFTVSASAGGRRGVTSTGWQQGTEPYHVQVPSDFFDRGYVGYLYTERPIYRPGEDVLYKGILREDDDAAYRIPTGNVPVNLVIRDAQGKELSRNRVALNDFGSFSGTFSLPTTAAIGDYLMQAEQAVPNANPNARFPISGISFSVAEFRKPEFQVDVKADHTSYANGDTIAASSTATFYFGGGLGDAPVAWSALASPTQIRPKGYETYSFGDADLARTSVVRDPLRASGKAQTNGDGVATFSVPAVLKGTEGAQQFQIAATITDQNAQAVAGSVSVTVHPADGYAGVRPAQYLATSGQEAKINLVTVDTEGAVRPNQKVAVGVYDRTWVTTKEQTPDGARQYRSDPVDKLITTLSATTDAKGEASVAYTPTKSGTLRLTADYTDAQGRTARSATYLWVSGSGSASWQITNDDTVKLIADKDTYEVGDTAEILVPAPYAGAVGLVTTERGKVMTSQVKQFPTNAERLSIPVPDSAVPDVFVSVVLYRPPTAEDPVPRYKVGYVELPVSTKTRQLNVEIKPDRAQAKPGDKVGYDLKVTDASGKPVKAELSVAVVDKAVLALADDRSTTGLKAFWFERGLGVITSSSLNVSVNRSNDVISVPPSGGKGGSGGDDRLRQDFKNTAFWQAQLATKDDGTVHVDVVMPDNLTTWRLQARAISGSTMVGEATNELVSTQPLLLRPALPRFLRVGDNVTLRLLVTNATDKSSDVSVNLKAEGVDVSGALDRTAKVDPGKSAVIDWPATVSAEGTAKLTFTAKGSGGLSDAVVQQLPAILDVTPEATATNGVVTGDSQIEAVYLPPYAQTKNGSLEIDVQSTLVGSLGAELSRFARRPGETSEPTDRVAARALATMAIARSEKAAQHDTSEYDRQIESDLATLVGRQKTDGGFAWCEFALCTSDPQVTAWVLDAFGEAHRDGRNVDAGAATRASGYVKAYVNRLTDLGSPADVNEKAQLVFALDGAQDGGGSLATMRSLQQAYRTKLANWGRAYLILGLLEDGVAKDDPAIRQLLDDLAQSASSSANGNHWEDERFARSVHTATRTTALVLDALVRADPQNPLIAETVRWLMNARGVQGWASDVERAQAVLSLSDFAASTSELSGDFTFRVQLNDQSILDGHAKPGDAATPLTKVVPLAQLGLGTTSLIDLAREVGKAGRLYYTLALRYETPAKGVDALNRGLAVSHQYTQLDDATKAVDHVKLGDTVRVTVTVIAPAEATHVVVDDLLPAGFEPVDPQLKTTDPKLVAQLDAERKKANRPAAIDYAAPWWSWYVSPWQQVDTRDDRVTLRAGTLPKGVHQYIYYVRATTAGNFFVAPAVAQDGYFPEVFGRSDSSRLIVDP